MIIDAHTHIFPPAIKANRRGWLVRDAGFRAIYAPPRARIATAEDLVASMDQAGIDVSVALNFGWASHDLCVQTNTSIIEAVRRYPDRLVGFGMVYPPAGAAAVAELQRCADAGLRGIGELRPDDQGFALDDARLLDPLMRVMLDYDMIVLSHASEPVGHPYPGKGRVSLESVYALVTRYPDLRVIMAHWGGGLPFYALMPEMQVALGNVWFDTAASPYLYRNEVFRVVAELVGGEKILFASDYPLMPQSRMLALIASLELAPADRDRILGGNAQRLLWGERADA
ncbi:MAG: amidohydrolase [Chloroflexi bacterium]|nr:amidohydrolase [Chloroflexota bacterium]